MLPAFRCAAVLGCLLACCGCGKKSQTVITPEGKKMTVTQEGTRSNITIEGPDGQKLQFAGEKDSLKLPDGFPDDVPVYPKARVIGTSTDKHAMVVTLETGDVLSDVSKFYTEKLKANGWEINVTYNTEENTMLSATKQRRSCTAVAGKTSTGTAVTLTVASD